MSSNSKTKSFPDDNFEEPLNQPKKDIVLKFSEVYPQVETFNKNYDNNYLLNEDSPKTKLWFDDVSPTSSNNVLSSDDEKVKKKENIFITIFSTVSNNIK